MDVIAKPTAVLGLDVGKQSHWACLLTREGEVIANHPVANRETALAELFSRLDPGTLVVVDQVRNIGALAIRCAREAGLDVAYLTGLAEHNAAKLLPGDAKTDERDASVIAQTAMAMPAALLSCPKADEIMDAARDLAAQRDFVVADSTRARNRLRAILFESCPAFEQVIDLSATWCLNLAEKLGGPWQVADASASEVGALTRGADRRKVTELVESTSGSKRPPEAVVAAEGRSARMLARRIREDAAEASELDEEISCLLAEDETYRCLLTIPGIGTRTASELAIGIDISLFRGGDRLASYCGLAPCDKRSGTSISSVTASRQGNKRLKNLLIFSCNSIVRSDNRFGRYYRMLREKRHMPHGKALKATARKRLKVIYAIMRDRVPYTA